MQGNLCRPCYFSSVDKKCTVAIIQRCRPNPLSLLIFAPKQNLHGIKGREAAASCRNAIGQKIISRGLSVSSVGGKIESAKTINGQWRENF